MKAWSEEAEWKYPDVNETPATDEKYDGNSTRHVECQKLITDIRKHGGGMRRLLKQ